MAHNVKALKRLGNDIPSPMAICRSTKLQKIMIYSTAAKNSLKLELMLGYLMQLKNVIRQPQLLQCTVVRCASV
jgi:hypothetical protein